MTTAPAPNTENPAPRTLRLGEMLIERGQIEAEDLERALELQQERGDKLGKILVDMGFIALRDVLAALSEQLGIPLATLVGRALTKSLYGVQPLDTVTYLSSIVGVAAVALVASGIPATRAASVDPVRSLRME